MTREIVTDYVVDNNYTVKGGSLYKVFINKIIQGQFLYSSELSFINYCDKKLIIDKKADILNPDSTTLNGHYELTNWRMLVGYRDKMFFDGKEYSFKRLKQDMQYSLFKKESWGQRKFQLQHDNENVTYLFALNVPALSLGSPFFKKPFSGSIELDNATILVALAGLYLIERALDNEIYT